MGIRGRARTSRTTDFRDVLAVVLDRHLGLAKPAAVFPDYGADARRYPGPFA